MRILGIDPGTGILGFGVIEIQDNEASARVIDAGVITTPANTPHGERLGEIFNELSGIVAVTKPDFVSIEKLFFSRNITTAMAVAEARGVALLVAHQAGLRVYEYTPNQIKQTVTGSGKADKKQVQEMVKVHLSLKTIPKPDDCADALAAAITHLAMSKLL